MATTQPSEFQEQVGWQFRQRKEDPEDTGRVSPGRARPPVGTPAGAVCSGDVHALVLAPAGVFGEGLVVGADRHRQTSGAICARGDSVLQASIRRRWIGSPTSGRVVTSLESIRYDVGEISATP